MEHVVIIGNGVAGITTARHLRKGSSAQITVIGKETRHFYSRTALMYIFMGDMTYQHTKPYEDSFWRNNRIDLIHDQVLSIDFASRIIRLNSTEDLSYDKLVIATDSKTATFGWTGMELNGVRGLYSLQDMEYFRDRVANTKHAVIVGGGLVGIELAEMLKSKNLEVTMLIREDGYWRNVLPPEEAHIITEHARRHGVNLLFETELQAILGDHSVEAVRTSSGEEIPCQLVGLTTGVVPNIDWIGESPLETDKGILVNENLETSVPGVYAAGDCAQVRTPGAGRNPIEPVWYVGRKMGESLGKTLAGNPKSYDPGVWFNSAKFFDIEYQTYGIVDAEIDQETFFWKSADGMKSFRVVWNQGSLTGINTLGIRLRHEVIDSWIQEAIGIDEFFQDLPKAAFDPEFYTDVLRQVQVAYGNKFPERNITIAPLPWYQRIFSA